MSIKDWWQAFLKKGFFFSWTRDWPGEKGLPPPNTWDPDLSDKTINKEIDPNRKDK
jgi:hypothetical protein